MFSATWGIFCALVFGVAASAAEFGPLQGVAYGSGNKAVVIVLHGDMSKGGPANYHYSFAKSVAKANKGSTAIALLRPGYSDGKGNKSAGSNNGRRDHYTKKNNDRLAQAITAIKAAYKPQRLIVVGHSGGAAQTGSVIGRYPGLIDSALLVSCPCNIAAWRSAKNASAWPSSQSPHKYLKSIAKSTRIFVINGSRDRNTRPKQAQDYTAQAQAAGLQAAYVELSGAEHGFNRMANKIGKIVKSEINR